MIRWLTVLTASGLLAQAPTRLDLRAQARNMAGLISPQLGTAVVCAGENCSSFIDRQTLLQRAQPPAGPGPCYINAFAIGGDGHLYFCAGQTGSRWLRTREPLVNVW